MKADSEPRAGLFRPTQLHPLAAEKVVPFCNDSQIVHSLDRVVLPHLDEL